jgi:hypothetical protein
MCLSGLASQGHWWQEPREAGLKRIACRIILKRVTRSRDLGLNEWTRSEDLKRRPIEYQDLSLENQEREGGGGQMYQYPNGL